MAAARLATADDAADIGRLLHDFNTEYDDYTPGPEVLAERIAAMIEAGEATVLLAGEGPDGVGVMRFRRLVFHDGMHAYLEELYVAPRSAGTGSAARSSTSRWRRRARTARSGSSSARARTTRPRAGSTRAPGSSTARAGRTGR